MLNNKGFNLWANHYDETVKMSEENNHYPFAGYKDILNTIFNEIMQKQQLKVLDIGFGTAVLTSKLYENGHQISGIDFSSEMIKIAKLKMPLASLIEWDISNGLPVSLKEHNYDFIVSTYALHHLTDEEKIPFIKNLLSFLAEDGKIIIGDIAFKTREQLDICRKESIEYWDSDEYYFVEEELHPLLDEFCHFDFYPLSHCGGIFIIASK